VPGQRRRGVPELNQGRSELAARDLRCDLREVVQQGARGGGQLGAVDPADDAHHGLLALLARRVPAHELDRQDRWVAGRQARRPGPQIAVGDER
jgi:hypothetical protein